LCEAGEQGRPPHGRFHHWPWRYPTAFMTLEEEIEMLEKAKGALENQLSNINARLEKLKA